MKLIMENWRKYLNELDLTDPTMAAIASSQDAEDADKRATAARDIMLGNLTPDFVQLVKSLAVTSGKIGANVVAMAADPTGQFAGYDFDTGKIRTSYEDFKDAQENFSRKPSLAGAGELTLASLAMIPLAGMLAKGVKSAKKGLAITKSATAASQAIEKSSKVSAKLRNLKTPQAIKLADQIDNEIKAFNVEAKKLTNIIKGGDVISATSKIENVPTRKIIMKKIFPNKRVQALEDTISHMLKPQKEGEIILYRGINKAEYRIPGGTSSQHAAARKLNAKGFDISARMGDRPSLRPTHEPLSNVLSSTRDQWFADSASAAASYALGAGTKSRKADNLTGGVIALRIDRDLAMQFFDARSTATTVGGRASTNFAFPPEMMKKFKESGNLAAVFF